MKAGAIFVLRWFSRIWMAVAGAVIVVGMWFTDWDAVPGGPMNPWNLIAAVAALSPALAANWLADRLSRP